MRDYFTFNGVNSTDYGCVIEHRPPYVAPKKVLEVFDVRGRSGALVIDTGAYENVTLEYAIFVPHANVPAFVNWIKGQKGYLRLEDTYNPDIFRKAYYEEDLTVENILGQFGQATIEFQAKPQRYLKSGETPILITENGYNLQNDWEEALPLITITGTGDITFSINNNIVNISALEDTITLDAETQNCYKGAINLNNTIIISGRGIEGVDPDDLGTLELDPLTGILSVVYRGTPIEIMYTVNDAGQLIASTNLNSSVDLTGDGRFPVLDKGMNVISWSGNVTSVMITPRWWRL